MIRFDTQDAGKLLLRVSLGLLMLLHGIKKLRGGIDGIIGNVDSHGLPTFFAYGVYLGEVVAPLFLLAGWMTRPAALVFAFNMIIAVWLSHADQVFDLGKSGGWAIELPALYFFGAIVLALIGAGRYSVSRGNGRFD